MKYETRGVLAGRYRGRGMERTTHTHLYNPEDVRITDVEYPALCNKKIGLADNYTFDCPTCPTCAKRFLKMKQKPARDHACSCSHTPKPRKKSKRKSARDDVKSRRTAGCPIGTEIQTLVLSQQFFTERQAEGWIRRHGFRSPKIDITPNNYRFRQHPPSNFRAGSFRTIRLRPGVEAVIGCPQ